MFGKGGYNTVTDGGLRVSKTLVTLAIVEVKIRMRSKRTVNQLCDMVCGLFYTSQLSTVQSLDASVARPRPWFPNYNGRFPRKAGSLIFLDVPGAKDHRGSRQRSRINSDLAAVVYALILDLPD